MTTQTRVFCTLQFEGFHRWKEAPAPVLYLRDNHRHIFHVRAEAVVEHGNRQIEFITLKQNVQAIIENTQAQGAITDGSNIFPHFIADWSCEHWAQYILQRVMGLRRVEVSEDGENGAVVEAIG